MRDGTAQGHQTPRLTGVTPVSAARQRKLHVGHFAFMRSVVQGLDARESWERYLRVEGEATDQRTVRATIGWIREEFAVAAKRHDWYGTARLVRIDATRIADPALELPSLEAFAEARGLEDERQSEQMAAYEAEYGRATQRLRRRARLIARQLEALRWLEGLVAQSPKAGDSVAAWPNPTLEAIWRRPTSSRSPSWWSACRFPFKLSLVIFDLALVTLSMCHRARRSPRRLPRFSVGRRLYGDFYTSHIGSQVVTARTDQMQGCAN